MQSAGSELTDTTGVIPPITFGSSRKPAKAKAMSATKKPIKSSTGSSGSGYVWQTGAPKGEIKFHITNKALLDTAYESGKDQIYNPETKTLVIAGTHNLQDVLTDIKDVPFFNIQNTKRYKEALYISTFPL